MDNIRPTAKSIGRAVFAATLALAALSSCITDGFDIAPEGSSIKFEAALPVSEAGATRADVDTEAENAITSINVLAYDQGTGLLLRNDKVASFTFSGTNKRVAKFNLPIPDGAYDMILIANAAAVIDPIAVGTAKSALESAMVQSSMHTDGNWNSDAGVVKPIVMVSSNEDNKVYRAVTVSSATTGLSFDLRRIAARIDVTNVASNFTMTSIRYYNYTTGAYIIPRLDSGELANSVPAGAQKSGDANVLLFENVGQAFEEKLYPLEAKGGIKTGVAGWENNPCLVIGGRYDGGGETFYRIDMVDGSGTYHSVLGNYRYDVTVTAVTGDGYPDAATAYTRASINCEATTEVMVQGGGYVTVDGYYYLTVSERRLAMAHGEEAKNLILKTNYPGWTGRIYTDAALTTEMPSSGEDKWLTLNPESGSAATVAGTAVELTAAANTGDARTAYVKFTAGRMAVVVTVTQEVKLVVVPDPDGDNPKTATNLNAYVGAFWRAAETGERIIRIGYTQRKSWQAKVEWYDARWDEAGGDGIVLSLDKSADTGVTFIAETENPAADHDSYKVSGTSRIVNSTVGSRCQPEDAAYDDVYIYFRIGLQKPYIPTAQYPARYAVISISYDFDEDTGEFAKHRKLYVRQGEGPDYLMRPGDTCPDPDRDVGGRTLAAKFSPYNLTASDFNGSGSVAPSVVIGTRGGVMTDYPTQGGAFFAWAQKINSVPNVTAYNTVPVTATPAGTIKKEINSFWNTLNSTYESCPSGYRRPTDGSMVNNASIPDNNINASTSEMGQSLYVNPARGTVNDYSNNIINSDWGYYADGFFDRRAIGRHVTSNPVYSAVAAGTSTVAYIGRLYHNPNNNASLFFPAAGCRNNASSATVNNGLVGYYWSSSSYVVAGVNDYRAYYTIMSENLSYRFGADRIFCISIRCVKE